MAMEEAKREFFAAANSGKGFVSFYPEIFEDKAIERRYLIKGGPGTGKSTFMKALAQKAQENGLLVEYYRCSSDPSSLDAIIIEGRVAVIDATSPHCVEAELAGARDEIINLGEFWEAEGLCERLEEISVLGEAKKKCYANAYRFLSAAMQVDEVRRGTALEHVNKEKMRRAANRFARRLKEGNGFEIKPRLCRAIGMTGSTHLDSYEKMAKTVCVIKDCYMLGSLFLAMLVDEARKKGNSITVSYYPLNPEYPDAIFFEDSGISAVLGDKDSSDADIYINMKRFVEKSMPKKEYRDSTRLFDGLVAAAEDSLREAGEKHFALENIYKNYMDFASESKFLHSFSTQLIKNIK